MPDNCNYCTNSIPLEYDHCPHCCIQLICPNVRAANTDDELTALRLRFESSKLRATQKGCGAVATELESALESSKAVLACSLSKLYAIAMSTGIFANYYDLMSVQFLPVPENGMPDWSKRRPQVEIELLGSEKHIRRMHYACLTLNRNSLPHYGECTVLLSEKMIGHLSLIHI